MFCALLKLWVRVVSIYLVHLLVFSSHTLKAIRRLSRYGFRTHFFARAWYLSNVVWSDDGDDLRIPVRSSATFDVRTWAAALKSWPTLGVGCGLVGPPSIRK